MVVFIALEGNDLEIIDPGVNLLDWLTRFLSGIFLNRVSGRMCDTNWTNKNKKFHVRVSK